jgi:hypothetical protein
MTRRPTPPKRAKKTPCVHPVESVTLRRIVFAAMFTPGFLTFQCDLCGRAIQTRTYARFECAEIDF